MSLPKMRLQHYDLQTLAKSLQLASIDVIKTTNMDIESHWFRSSGPADLYFWKAKDKIVKHQISIYNQIVEWNEFDGVKTGYVNDDIQSGQAAEVICFDKQVNESVVKQAICFLNDVQGIDGRITLQLIENYNFYSKWPFKVSNNPLVRGLKKILFKKKKD